jgi:hypothetical protein
MLLKHGADPRAATRIDNYGTPLEEAERFGHTIGAAALRRQFIDWDVRGTRPFTQPTAT